MGSRWALVCPSPRLGATEGDSNGGGLYQQRNRPAPTRKIRKLANVALNIDGTVGHIESMAVEVHDLTDRVGSMLDHLDSSLERLDDSWTR